jgi:O-antigen ligase
MDWRIATREPPFLAALFFSRYRDAVQLAPALLAALIASAALFYLVPPWPLAAIGLAIFFVLAWFRTDLALGVVLIFVPYFMRPKHLGHLEFAPSELLLLTVAAIAGLKIVRSLTNERAVPNWEHLRRSPFLAPAVLFLIGATISTLFAAERHLALREYREVIAEPLLYFVLLLLFVRSSNHANSCVPTWLGWVVVLTGLFPSLIGLSQLVTHQDLVSVPGASYERIRAWYGSPDNLGLLLDRTLPMWLALMLSCGVLAHQRGIEDVQSHGTLRRTLRAGIAKYGLVLAGVVMLVAAVLTFSRGSWIAIPVALIGMLMLRYRWGRWIAVAAAVIVLLALAVGSSRIEHVFSAGHYSTVQRRLDLWRSSLRMLHDHPIFGVGPDNFLHYYAPVSQRYIQCPHGLGYMESEAHAEPCLSHPHNEVLDLWLSTGIIGLAAFIWLQGVFWQLLLRKNQQLLRASPIVFGTAGAMIASLIHGLIDNVYFLIDLSMLFWYLMAIVSIAQTSELAWSPRFTFQLLGRESQNSEPNQ